MVKVWNKSEKFVRYPVFGYKMCVFVHSNKALVSALRLFCLVVTLSNACMRDAFGFLLLPICTWQKLSWRNKFSRTWMSTQNGRFNPLLSVPYLVLWVHRRKTHAHGDLHNPAECLITPTWASCPWYQGGNAGTGRPLLVLCSEAWYESLLLSGNREPPHVTKLLQSWVSRAQKVMNLLKCIYNL